MFKKILIAGLVVIVMGALGVSVYNAVQAKSAQIAADGVSVAQGASQGAEQGNAQAGQSGTNDSWLSDLANGQQANGQQANAQQGGGYGRGSNGQDASGGQGGSGQGKGGQGGSGGQGGHGQGNGQQGGSQNLVPAGDLSEAEAQGLLYMREEEKLARDVYLALYEKWGLSEFQTISQSEQMHMDALKNLVERYGLTDPVQAEAGKFTDAGLQALYDELVARGSQSVSEALKVAGLVEETDILDLQEHLAASDNADLQQVYNNLLRGSENHLKGFANALSIQTGETYQPQVMDTAAYQAILASSQGGYGQGGGGGGGNGGQGGKGRNP